MKRILIMLLITCSTITACAETVAGGSKQPEKVIRTLNAIIEHFGHKRGQSFAINRNPNTGIIESKEKITTFSCAKSDASFEAVATSFIADEPLGYQILHLVPGTPEKFSLKVVTNEGSKNIFLRTKEHQEMWLMCTKNPENPQLRDAYAIVWEDEDDFNLDEGKNEVKGTVYMITSLRPDLYTKNLETSKNTFRIDGRVGYDLTDSLYVVYMADTSEELDKQADDAFIAYMPVKNKRFSFSVEIDKPKVGRIRTVMPDGSLCHLWTNLDFVPGETYQITTHNGYYDEDRDYERRVGRYSGKSLLNNRQVRGIDDVSVVDNADVMIADTICENIIIPSEWEPSPALKMQLEVKGSAMDAKRKSVEALYRSLNPQNNVSWMRKDHIFERITKQNKEVDAAFHDILKLLKGVDIPADEKAEILGDGYSALMNFFIEQNKGLTEMMNSGIQLPKSAQKTQKALNKYIEKYMTEMTKLIE